MRRTFLDILNNMKINPRNEYVKLYRLFYDSENNYSLYELLNQNFYKVSFRGTCMDLDEFDKYNDIYFDRSPQNFDIDYLISFCEYIINFVGVAFNINNIKLNYDLAFLQKQVLTVVQKLGYTFVDKEGIIIFIQESPEAMFVAECVSNDELSYKIWEYNHHKLKGDLSAKKTILLKIADELEPKRKTLKTLDTELEKDLFIAFNNFNIRHNNITVGSPKYSAPFAELSPDVQETLYDYVYKLSLIAFIKLENGVDKIVFDEIKQHIK